MQIGGDPSAVARLWRHKDSRTDKTERTAKTAHKHLVRQGFLLPPPRLSFALLHLCQLFTFDITMVVWLSTRPSIVSVYPVDHLILAPLHNFCSLLLFLSSLSYPVRQGGSRLVLSTNGFVTTTYVKE